MFSLVLLEEGGYLGMDRGRILDHRQMSQSRQRNELRLRDRALHVGVFGIRHRLVGIAPYQQHRQALPAATAAHAHHT